METEEKVWEILLSADKKDYERICCEFGITDFRGMLKKLTEMKKEREEEIAQVHQSVLSMKERKLIIYLNCLTTHSPMRFSCFS